MSDLTQTQPAIAHAGQVIAKEALSAAGGIDKIALLRPEQAAVIMQLPLKDLPKYLPPIIFGVRTIRYRLADIEEVIERKRSVKLTPEMPV